MISNPIYLGSLTIIKYPDTPFILALSPPHVVLPNSMINEIISLPEVRVPPQKYTYHQMLGEYMDIGKKHDRLIRVIKQDLTRNISRIVLDLQDETKYACAKGLGDLAEWSNIRLYDKVVGIVARVSGRVFVCQQLSRDITWLNATTSFT